ncbi:MAG TPA: NAD-dependent epimerase/dehydratase family protein, partial [Candidatus Atribacteria bacterium]|nr:NAD-dependent epimerase/dehydratase family protein [Candidatus Atribacteria bacterium]
MKKDSNIFVAGATGLVGGAIVRKLLDEGFTNIIGSYHSKDPSSIYPSRLTPHALRFTKIDLTRQKDTEEFFEKERPEYVFLAAAKVGGILANNTYKADFIYENIMIAANVIHASYKYGVKKLLNLGSSCIYPKFAPQPMKEEYLLTGLLEPTNEPYAVAKIAAIKLCKYYNEQYGTNFISVMPTNLYGPNDNFDLYTSHVLPALIRKFHLARCLEEDNWEALRKDLNRYPVEGVTGKSPEEEILNILAKYGITVHASRITPHESRVTVTLWGTGSPYREFLYVDDLADT